MASAPREQEEFRVLRGSAEGLIVALGVFVGLVWAFALEQANNLTQGIITLHSAVPAGSCDATLASAFEFNTALLRATEYSVVVFALFILAQYAIARNMSGKFAPLSVGLLALVLGIWILLFTSVFFSALPSSTFQEIITPNNPTGSEALTEITVFMQMAGYYVKSVVLLSLAISIWFGISVLARWPKNPFAWLGVLPAVFIWKVQGLMGSLPTQFLGGCGGNVIETGTGFEGGTYLTQTASSVVVPILWGLGAFLVVLSAASLVRYLKGPSRELPK